ncbi:MAG: DUF3427 domain-containing protein, partial [Bacteroidota bacterium]
HSAASSYQQLLGHFKPTILLGLTATPERHDGSDITSYFGNTISAEIRLPDALNKQLLCPFQYFGITDETDVSRVSWRKGRYDSAELEKIYNEDHRRVQDILRNCRKYLTDFQNVRALGFCVSKKHAEFMAAQFILRGVKAGFLHSESTLDRKTVIQQFRRREINYLFVVDLFNEGIDIPEIDTLLFLRPTESLTVFLQQLGRGLRLHEDKTCLTVLDFVGQQHSEYSFEHKFRAMIGKTRTRVKDELDQDFPNLPLGCSITLEETAREVILKNIQRSYRSGEQSLLKAMVRFKSDYQLELNLENFSTCMGIDLFTIYKTKQLFYELKHKLDGNTHARSPFAETVVRVLGNTWLTTDSDRYFRFLLELVSGAEIDAASVSGGQYLMMCHMDVYDAAPEMETMAEVLQNLQRVFSGDELRTEVLAFLHVRLKQLECIEKPIQLRNDTVLQLHGRYSRNQILSALSENTLKKKASSREGVYRIKSLNTELLFVTLYKSEGKFNARTMYHDYFINEELFHWQSQNSTTPESEVGKSYIHQR